ncbi:hypothetical protein PVAP13_9KG541926 [Panicum virgatum]|uniref:Secreted protein n=1 Tax=Panicum virgatum TaxID=38727 RepID=A0A8T0NVS4_PANVG|nr:hypothetical protein PVAP13_9KG541926 [Panicum virgatum]
MLCHPHPLVLSSPWFLFLLSAPFRIHGGADGCAVSSLTAYLHNHRSSRKRHQGGHVGVLLTCRSYGWAVCAGTHEAMAASKGCRTRWQSSIHMLAGQRQAVQTYFSRQVIGLYVLKTGR